MAFVNEKISDKDIEKYNLFQFNEKYAEEKKKGIMSFSDPYSWVIDKKNEIFLRYFSRFIDEIDDHAIYFKKEELFIFYYEKQFYEIILKREREHKTFGLQSKVILYESTWSFVSITPKTEKFEEMKSYLKDALQVYGELGLPSKDIPRKIIFEF